MVHEVKIEVTDGIKDKLAFVKCEAMSYYSDQNN